MVDQPELELVQRALRGDEPCFEQLLRSAEPSLTRWVETHLRPRADVCVDDVLNEARLYIFQRLDRFDSSYPFGVFALALTRNVLKRLLRRRGREVPWDEPWPVVSESASAAGPGDPSRWTGSDASFPPTQEFLELFEIFARHGGYPHQQIAFGFSVMLFGRDRRPRGQSDATSRDAAKVPVSGNPTRVVEELGPRELGEACEQMFTDIHEELRLDGGYTERVREPLRARLRLTGAALFQADPTSRRLFPHLLDRLVTSHRLEEYFGSDGRRSVADWTRIVKNRIRRVLERGTDSGRLRAVASSATAELDDVGRNSGRKPGSRQEGTRG